MGREAERNDAFYVAKIDELTSAVGLMTVENEQSFTHCMRGGEGFEDVGEPPKTELVIRPTVPGESDCWFRIVELAKSLLKQPVKNRLGQVRQVSTLLNVLT